MILFSLLTYTFLTVFSCHQNLLESTLNACLLTILHLGQALPLSLPGVRAGLPVSLFCPRGWLEMKVPRFSLCIPLFWPRGRTQPLAGRWKQTARAQADGTGPPCHPLGMVI